MTTGSSMGRLVRGMCLLAAAVPAALSAAPVSPEERTIHGQPAWVIATNDVELAVTKRGGHMAPVTFDRKAASPIRPYHISPWQDEGLETFSAAVLEPLRVTFSACRSAATRPRGEASSMFRMARRPRPSGGSVSGRATPTAPSG